MKYSRLLRFFSGKENEIEPSEENIEDENELVAVIAAAIQEYCRTSPGARLEVVSIKRTGQSTPLWNRAGRLERMSRRL